MHRKNRIKLIQRISEGIDSSKPNQRNESNEKQLNKTINRIIRPKKIKTINTHKLLSCMPDANYAKN